MKRLHHGVLALAMSALCLPTVWAGVKTYHIGNSLTWDGQPNALVRFSAQRGRDHEVGYHINCVRALSHIVANPSQVCVDPTAVGTFGTALPNNTWEAVTLQPHDGSTLGGEAQAALQLINLTRTNAANGQTRFFFYAGWPIRQTNFPTYWTADVVDVDATATQHRRQYYDHLVHRLRDALAGQDAAVNLIPVGEVMYRLDQEMRAGNFPSFTNLDNIYRDNAHMGSIGKFVASVTMYATLFAENPVGLVREEDFFGTIVTPERALYLESLIWDVVSHHALTGVPEPGTGLVLLTAFISLLTGRQSRFDKP